VTRFIIKIILIGILLGILGTSVTMLFSLTIYFVLRSLDLIMFSFFLKAASWVALAIGLACVFAWYGYILTVARRYFTDLMKEFINTFNSGEKKK